MTKIKQVDFNENKKIVLEAKPIEEVRDKSKNIMDKMKELDNIKRD